MMCAKGIKDEPYNDDSRELDLEQFRNRLEEIASSIQDPRAQDNQKHSLFILIATIFCAIVAGANSINAIHRYALSKRKWLMNWLTPMSEIPSYDTFWWLLVRLDPLQTETLFRQWTSTLAKEDFEDLIAIDGKRVRGASNKKNQQKSLLHMVSAWSSGRGLILGQIKTETKSNDIDWLPMKDEWKGLKSIVMLKSFRTIDGTTSEERRYYISSLPPEVDRIARATRSHWGIENKVHWVLDVDFQEDLSQISIGHAAENFSILRRLTLNVIRLDQDKKKSLRGRREIAGWDDSYMAYLLRLAIIKKF